MVRTLNSSESFWGPSLGLEVSLTIALSLAFDQRGKDSERDPGPPAGLFPKVTVSAGSTKHEDSGQGGRSQQGGSRQAPCLLFWAPVFHLSLAFSNEPLNGAFLES